MAAMSLVRGHAYVRPRSGTACAVCGYGPFAPQHKARLGGLWALQVLGGGR